jgi:methylase of polypeptide subunit release factors
VLAKNQNIKNLPRSNHPKRKKFAAQANIGIRKNLPQANIGIRKNLPRRVAATTATVFRPRQGAVGGVDLCTSFMHKNTVVKSTRILSCIILEMCTGQTDRVVQSLS